MNASSVIVVGTDGSNHAGRAVRWAADEAARAGATLRVVTAQEETGDLHALAPTWQQALDQRSREVLDATVSAIKEFGHDLAVETDVGRGRPVDVLVAEGQAADLVVVGSRGRGGFTGLLLGSTSQRLATQVKVPVVVVPEGVEEDPDARGIAVAVDGSEESRRALTFAVGEARQRGVPLKAISVVHDSNMYASTNPIAYTWVEQAIEEATIALREELTPHREAHPDLEVVEIVERGHPVAVIREAAEGSELLVLGSRGRGMTRSFVLGSVSQGILHHAQLPVAVLSGR